MLIGTVISTSVLVILLSMIVCLVTSSIVIILLVKVKIKIQEELAAACSALATKANQKTSSSGLSKVPAVDTSDNVAYEMPQLAIDTRLLSDNVAYGIHVYAVVPVSHTQQQKAALSRMRSMNVDT